MSTFKIEFDNRDVPTNARDLADLLRSIAAVVELEREQVNRVLTTTEYDSVDLPYALGCLIVTPD